MTSTDQDPPSRSTDSSASSEPSRGEDPPPAPSPSVPVGNSLPEEALRVIASSEIFLEGSRRVIIRHDDREYLLLVTKQGKLLLNRIR